MVVNYIRKSLRNKLIVILLTVSLCSIIVVGLLSFFNARNSLQKAAMEALEANGNLKAQIIELFFQERKNDISAAQDFFNIKTNLSIVSKYANDRLNPEYLNAKRMLDGQLQTFQKVYNYTDIVLVNTDGEIVYSCEKSHEKYDLDTKLSDQDSKAFEEGKKGVYFSDVFVNNKISDNLTMLVTAPAYSLDKKFIGVIVFEINMEPIYKLTQDWTGLGITGETLIGKKINNDFVFLNPFRHDSEYKLNQKINIGGSLDIPMREAVQGNSGSGLKLDYRGEKVITHWRYIPIVGWGLGVKIDQKEAFASIVSLRNYIIVFSFSFILLLTVVAFWISKKIVNPLNSLNKFTDRVSAGDYSILPEVKTEDELGQLTVSFINMTQKLQKYHIHLEELVKDRTAELSFSNAELAKAARLKDEFLANMSHELRTPLNSIIGFTGMVLMGIAGDINAEQKKQLTMVKSSAHHLLNLINDILDISKIESGKTDVFPEEFYINDVIQEAINTVIPLVNDKGIELLEEIPEKTLILSDRKFIKQILMNLLSNAVKFTDTGSVKIESGVLKNKHIVVRVIDTGIGIKKEDVGKLFEMFKQVDMSSTKNHEGTGLGLYLSKKLVTLLGGDITVKSEYGKGSEFTVNIPLKYKEVK